MDSNFDPQTPRPSLKRLGGAFIGLLQSHLELIGLEIQEQKARTLALLLLAGIALIMLLLILIGLSAALVIGLWSSSPIAVILGLCLFYGLIFALCITRASHIASDSTHPFQTTLEELERNRERLLP